MIEVEREEKAVQYPSGDMPKESPPEWRWHVRGKPGIAGRSREPLLDACRELGRMGASPSEAVGLFRPGSSTWDLRTTVGYGSSKTVEESRKISPRFAAHKLRPE